MVIYKILFGLNDQHCLVVVSVGPGHASSVCVSAPAVQTVRLSNESFLSVSSVKQRGEAVSVAL